MSQKKLVVSNPIEGTIDAIRNSAGSGSVLYDDTTDTLIANKFSGDGSGLVNVPISNVSGSISVANGGTGLTSLVPGAIYIANTTGSIIPLTGSTGLSLSWDSNDNRWIAAPQPYDLSVDIYGNVAAASKVLSFKAPRKINILYLTTNSNLSEQNFTVKVDNVTKNSYPFILNAGSVLEIFTNNNIFDISLTVAANLIT